MDSTDVSTVVLVSPSNMSRMESLDKTRSGGATSSGVDMRDEPLSPRATAEARRRHVARRDWARRLLSKRE